MLAVIRIRGLKHVQVDIRQAMDSLNLDRKNHCVLINMPETDRVLHKVKDYVAFGHIKKETIVKLLEKRGRVPGDKRITDAFLKEKKMDSFETLAQSLADGKTTFSKLGIKPVFRLNSPKKGFSTGGIKKSVALKGPLGFHADGIDALVEKMM